MSAPHAWRLLPHRQGARPVGALCRGCVAVAMIAVAPPAAAAGDVRAHGVAMIFGGARMSAAPGTAARRGVVLTFAVAGAQPRTMVTAYAHRRMLALAPLVAEIAHAFRLDAALLMAVIHAESAGDRRAVSPKGATGLMQLMPATGAEYGATDLFDARQNIVAGARFLGDLLQRYGSRDLALAAFNAGAGAVDRYGGRIPPYDETRRYVVRVNGLYARYAYADEALTQAVQ